MANENDTAPTSKQWDDLCSKVKNLTPSEVGESTWYLVIAIILTSSPRPQLLSTFYSHLSTTDPQFAEATTQRTLSVRLRDLLMKSTTILGAPRMLGALIPLAKAEADLQGTTPAALAQSSSLSPNYDLDTFNVQQVNERGKHTINTIYGPLLQSIFPTFGSHRADTEIVEVGFIYGLYLSEHSVLSPIETEVVVYTGILCTGLRGPSLWHTRGLGRLLGARGTDDNTKEMHAIKDVVRAVKTAALEVIEFLGLDMVRQCNVPSMPNVGHVVAELGGWGEDPFPA